MPPEPQALAIDATELTRTYPARRRTPSRTALDAVSLRVPERQFVALLGPNGSGKSTLLRILATLDAPTSGAITILGRARAIDARADLGVVFQHEALDPLLTSRENLRLQASLFGLSARDAADAIERVASTLDVADRLDDRAASLSGGLRRRVDLARALLASPRLLLLDEPTTGLDHAARVAFLDAIDDLRRASPITVVLCTHLMDEADRAQRVVMLSEGRIVADDAPTNLRASLGGAVLRTSPGACSQLSDLALAERNAGADIVLSGHADAVATAAHRLASCAIPFTFGPPTLADVYLARTGRELTLPPAQETAA
jgi:ABC-2 type transport system ATP-binding protein